MLNVKRMRPSVLLVSRKHPVLSVSVALVIDHPGCGFTSPEMLAPTRISPVSAFTIFPLNVSALHIAGIMRQNVIKMSAFLSMFFIYL